MINGEDRKFILNFAREIIGKKTRNEKIKKPENYPKILDEKRGIFCTITKNNELRGCIGVPYPAMQLVDALIEAASSVCEDSRFPVLREQELEEIKIEISILTEPKIMEEKNKEILNSIKIGEDGLIIEYGPYSGLLLPQVAVEHKWDKKEFLNHLCMKAGLEEGMWSDKNAKIYKFQAEIFSE